MLKAAKGNFEENSVGYINNQLRYYLGFSTSDLMSMSDEEWAQHYAMLQDIRKQEAKANRF